MNRTRRQFEQAVRLLVAGVDRLPPDLALAAGIVVGAVTDDNGHVHGVPGWCVEADVHHKTEQSLRVLVEYSTIPLHRCNCARVVR